MPGGASVFRPESFSWASFSHISWAPGDESGIPPEELAPEYRNQVCGGGGRARLHLPEFEREVLTREHVEKSWDLLETRLRVQAEDAAKKVRAQKPSVPVPPKAPEGTPDALQAGGIQPDYTSGSKLPMAVVSIAQAATQLAERASAAALSKIQQRRADEDAFILSLLLAAA